MDQLLCFPEPLMPAKGFSWKSASKPNFSAFRSMTSMKSTLLSQEKVEWQ